MFQIAKSIGKENEPVVSRGWGERGMGSDWEVVWDLPMVQLCDYTKTTELNAFKEWFL